MSRSHAPLKLRKQMLLMRAAVERVELAQHLDDVRRAATVSAIFRNAMPSDRTRSFAARVVELAKRYPFVTSAASLIAARFPIPILKRAVKWGGVATLVYRLWLLWQKHRNEHPGDRHRPGISRSGPFD